MGILYTCKTKFQEVQIAKIALGKTLYMDRKMQSCSFDEHIYHECLVHPAMLNVKNPKNVFIGGGGEFATAREVLRHKSVEKCVMVDIDQEGVRFCRENLEENAATFKDTRLELHIEDAKKVLEESS